MFPPAPKKGMVKFPGKGHFKRVKQAKMALSNAQRHVRRAFLNMRRQAKRALLSQSCKLNMILPNKIFSVPRFTGKTRITGKTTEIPERPKNNWEILTCPSPINTGG